MGLGQLPQAHVLLSICLPAARTLLRKAAEKESHHLRVGAGHVRGEQPITRTVRDTLCASVRAGDHRMAVEYLFQFAQLIVHYLPPL